MLEKEPVRLPEVGTERTRVGIDARSVQWGPAGIATYVSNLLKYLPWLDGLESSEPVNNLIFNCVRVPGAEWRRRWQVYHAPSYTCPLISFCPIVMTVHDISYLAHPEWYPYKKGFVRLAYYRACLRRADRIVVPSQFSKQEIVRLFAPLEDRIRIVPMGVSDFFSPTPDLAGGVSQQLNLPSRYILHVGDLHSRRNLWMLKRAAEQVGLPLVLVGRPLEEDSIPEGALLFTDISMDVLKGIYSAATLFAYPSLYEGFGLPLLEAMACGVPVVASNRASLPEVCGQAAVLVEPDQEALVTGLQRALENRESLKERGLQRAAEFSWEQTARRTLEVYRELT